MTRTDLEAAALAVSTAARAARRVDPTAGYPPARLPTWLLREIVRNANRVAALTICQR